MKEFKPKLFRAKEFKRSEQELKKTFAPFEIGDTVTFHSTQHPNPPGEWRIVLFRWSKDPGMEAVEPSVYLFSRQWDEVDQYNSTVRIYKNDFDALEPKKATPQTPAP